MAFLISFSGESENILIINMRKWWEKKIFNKTNEKINSNVLINIDNQLLPKLYPKLCVVLLQKVITHS